MLSCGVLSDACRTMKTYQRILLILQVLMFSTVQTNPGTVFTGTEGGRVEISCSYPDSHQYTTHYFCRDPCGYSDVLIKTQKYGIVVSKGRYSILNTVSTRSISVTIRNLRLRDSGVYYCGVDKWGQDTLTKVRVSVSKDTTTATTGPTSSIQTPNYTDTSITSRRPSTTAQPTHAPDYKNSSTDNPTSSQPSPSTPSGSSALFDLPLYGGVLGLLLCCVLVALVVLYNKRSNTQTTFLKPSAPENQSSDPPPDQDEGLHVYDEMMTVYSLAGPMIQEDPSEFYSMIQHAPPAEVESLYSEVAPH